MTRLEIAAELSRIDGRLASIRDAAIGALRPHRQREVDQLTRRAAELHQAERDLDTDEGRFSCEDCGCSPTSCLCDPFGPCFQTCGKGTRPDDETDDTDEDSNYDWLGFPAERSAP